MRLKTSLNLAALLVGFTLPLRAADELKPLPLPPPQIDGGKPLMQALQQRHTTREFKPDPLPPQELGNLLWAAFGINRPQTGQRTAPSAMDSQEIDLYVALREGLYLYEPKPHRLRPVAGGDFRAKAGGQDFVKQAPVTLIFVADLPRLSKAKPETRPFYAGFDTGCISQNVYLYCASAGLGTVVHELDRAPLIAAMKLRSDQQIILTQTVGYPKEPAKAHAAGAVPAWAKEQLELRKTVDNWIRTDIQTYHDKGFKRMFPNLRGHGADEIGGWTRSWLGAYCLSGNEDIPRTMKALRDTWHEGVTKSGHYYHGYPANEEGDTIKHTAEGFSQGMLNILYLDLKDPKSVQFVEDAAALMGNWVEGMQPFYNWKDHHFLGYFLGTKAPEVGKMYDYESWVHFRVLAIVLGAYEATRNPRYLELCEDYCGFWAREILGAPSDGEVPSNIVHASEEQWRQWRQGPEVQKATYANRFFRVEGYQRKLALIKSFQGSSYHSPCDIVETWLCLYRHQPNPEHQKALQRLMRAWIALGKDEGRSQMGAYEPHVGLHLPWYRDITGDTSLDAMYLAAFPQGAGAYLITGDEKRLEGLAQQYSEERAWRAETEHREIAVESLAATVNHDFAANWQKMPYTGCWWRTRGGFSSAAIAPALFMPALGGLCNFFGRVPWVNVLYYTDGHPGLPEDVAALYVPSTAHTQRGVKLVNTGSETRKVRVRPVRPASTENLLFLEPPPEKELIDVTLAPGEIKQVSL